MSLPPSSKPPYNNDDGGWISPNGSFYQCPDYEHGGLALVLIEALDIARDFPSRSSVFTLEGAGWVHLSEGCIYTGFDRRLAEKGTTVPIPPTQAQRDTLFDIAQHLERWEGAAMRVLRDSEAPTVRRYMRTSIENVSLLRRLVGDRKESA